MSKTDEAPKEILKKIIPTRDICIDILTYSTVCLSFYSIKLLVGEKRKKRFKTILIQAAQNLLSEQ